MLKLKALAFLAKQFIGVNASSTEAINRMRRATDGVANGEPWCVCFGQYLVREVDGFFSELGLLLEALTTHKLPATESSQQLWSKMAQESKRDAPVIGALGIYRLQSNPTFGHLVIVTGIYAGGITTVEGNTSQPGSSGGTEAERNGRGAWGKNRADGNIPGFDRLGFLLPWG